MAQPFPQVSHTLPPTRCAAVMLHKCELATPAQAATAALALGRLRVADSVREEGPEGERGELCLCEVVEEGRLRVADSVRKATTACLSLPQFSHTPLSPSYLFLSSLPTPAPLFPSAPSLFTLILSLHPSLSTLYSGAVQCPGPPDF